MIVEFSVTNFLSFKDRVTFSMLANSSDGLDNNYVVINNKRILKVATIYGANASGKTNLFDIIVGIVDMIIKSNSMDINGKLPVVPFMFDKETVNKPSEFEIKFIVQNIQYVYGFSLDNDKIYEEYLYYYPNGRETKIFDRINVNEYSFPQKDEKFLKDIAAKNAPNKFFLSTATNWNYDKTRVAYEFFSSSIDAFNNLDNLKNISCEMYAENDVKLKNFALDFLKKTDLNIVDYKIEKHIIVEGNTQKKFYDVVFKHNGSDNYINLLQESMGTKIVFYFIPFLAEALSNQKIIIVDELDRSLHPFLVELIVQMFNDSEINKNGSQLIFNTHDTNLLDLNILRRDQIWFTEKDNNTGVSDLYPLSDFSVRKSENIEKGYLLGRYGAVPFINNDINLWEKE